MFNLHVLKMEFKRSYKGLLVWSLSIGLFMYLIIILYPMVKDVYAQMQLSDDLKPIMDKFGGLPENILEYFAIEGAMLLHLFGSIFAVMVGFNAISREEREQTTDLIYSLPVSRGSFFFNKLIIVIMQVLSFCIIVALISILGFLTVGEDTNLKLFMEFILLYTVLLLIISSFGFALACFIKGGKSLISLIIPLPFYVTYLISTLVENKTLNNIKYVSPFTFSDPNRIIKEQASLEWISLTIFGLLSITLLIIAYIEFKRKEFTA